MVSRILLNEYLFFNLFSNNLIIVSAIKQVRKWDSIWSFLDTHTGLPSNPVLVTLKVSSIF